jgi:hypothetical protein
MISLVAVLIASEAGAELAAESSPSVTQRAVFFGDLHVHTAISLDASLFGTRNRPDDAYRFARGQAIELRALLSNQPALAARLARPLDFAAVTDHAENQGAVSLCRTPGSSAYATEACSEFREALSTLGDGGIEETFPRLRRAARAIRGEAVCGADGSLCLQAAADPWRETQEAATRWNEPHRFTTFVAYEYSPLPENSKVHRNVIFRNDAVIDLPISSDMEPSVIRLWQRLRAECIDAENGCDAIAIPHNSNLSNGRLFALDYGGASDPAAQAEVARLRARLEPVVEMFQTKGQSECRNGMWKVLGATDELCNFEQYRDWDPSLEKLPWLWQIMGRVGSWLSPMDDCRDASGSGALLGRGCVSRLDYVRTALAAGLAEERRIGVNPYPFGLIGSTDAHDGSAGDVDEWTRDGASRHVPARQLGRDNPGGLAAVWAEENTREALFRALRRRETYATSGPRMQVAFFGGWDLPDDLCHAPGLVTRGLAGGVPMGGQLSARPGARSPRFVISALRDPGTPEHPGEQLQRVQIIKVWAGKGAELHQRVFEVAASDTEAGVNLETCETRGSGADALCGAWQDPDFDASRRAAYYARVIERPSCRFLARTCRALAADGRPRACDDTRVAKQVRERAWTSPIWITPEKADVH